MGSDDAHAELWCLFKEHQQGLYSYALSITCHRALAEDAVHNGIAEVARHDGEVSDLKVYVFRAVRNEALAQVRSGKRTRSLDTLEVDSFLVTPKERGPDRRCLEDEEARLLTQAMRRIPSEQYEAIVLRIYAGLKLREIAEMLGKPLTTVASRYQRGLEELATHMKELGHEA